DRVRIARVDADLAEHPAVGAGVAAHVLVAVAHLAPTPALVVRAVDLRRFDAGFPDRPPVGVAFSLARRTERLVVVEQRIEDARIGGSDVQSDAAAELWRG